MDNQNKINLKHHNRTRRQTNKINQLQTTRRTEHRQQKQINSKQQLERKHEDP